MIALFKCLYYGVFKNEDFKTLEQEFDLKGTRNEIMSLYKKSERDFIESLNKIGDRLEDMNCFIKDKEDVYNHNENNAIKIMLISLVIVLLLLLAPNIHLIVFMSNGMLLKLSLAICISTAIKFFILRSGISKTNLERIRLCHLQEQLDYQRGIYLKKAKKTSYNAQREYPKSMQPVNHININDIDNGNKPGHSKVRQRIQSNEKNQFKINIGDDIND